MTRVRVPADVERPDRVLAGLTARQVAILATGAIVLWAAYQAMRAWLPWPALAAGAVPVAAVTVWLALGRRYGLGADRLAAAWLRQAAAPRRLIPTPDGIPATPGWAGPPGRPPAPLSLPARSINREGVLDLGDDGAGLVCRASSLSLDLRADAEQQVLVAAFGRWLNGLTGPVQILVRAERADLRPAIVALAEAAGGLPHPALEAAAREHAAFLADLAARRDVLARQVLVVLRDPAPADQAGEALVRRAEEAAAGLGAAGIQLAPLEGEDAAAALAAACDPQAPARPGGLAEPDAIITGGW